MGEAPRRLTIYFVSRRSSEREVEVTEFTCTAATSAALLLA
jgi:hypothetical protein